MLYPRSQLMRINIKTTILAVVVVSTFIVLIKYYYFAYPTIDVEQLAKHQKTMSVKNAEGEFYQSDFVWVYNSEFAHRFDMPSKYVDNTLQGAMALAYSKQKYANQMCGWFGNENRCTQGNTCYVDVYIASNTFLPWKNKERSGILNIGDYSNFYLPAHPSNINAIGYDPLLKKSDQYYSKLAFDDIMLWSYTYKEKPGYGDAYIVAYKQNFATGIDFFRIEAMASCTNLLEHPAVIIQFASKDSINFNLTTPLTHKVILPDQFTARIRLFNLSLKEVDILKQIIHSDKKQF
jgi:hypothetical protein